MTAGLPSGTPDAVAFLGTPDVAVTSLHALHSAGLPIRMVVTRPDARRGRRESSTSSPVKRAAEDLGIPVTHDLENVRAALAGARSPLGVVVAYGRRIPLGVLDVVPMVNLHFSLLPRWRGAAPVERAILAGDRETGVCVMELAPELDTGPVHSRVRVTIGEHETADALRRRLSETGSTALTTCCVRGFGVGTPQSGQPTYAAKITTSDRVANWTGSTSMIARQVRIGGAITALHGVRVLILEATPSNLPAGASSEPGVVTLTPNGDVIVACADGALVLRTVQQEGRRALEATSWWNGIASAHRGSIRFGS